MWIDTHAHLYDFSSNELHESTLSAQTNYVSAIVNTSTSIETSFTVIDQCSTSSLLWASVGISPFDVEDLSLEWVHCLENFLRDPKVISIGEIGLDSSNPRYPEVSKQRPVFLQQLELCNKYELPAVVHSRGIEEEVFYECVNCRCKRVVFHCFTGKKELVKKILDQGYIVSFSGIITFKKSALLPLIDYVPLNQMLIETDTPYLTPEPFRRQTNRPHFVRLIGERIAQLKSVSETTASDIMKKTFVSTFTKVNV